MTTFNFTFVIIALIAIIFVVAIVATLVIVLATSKKRRNAPIQQQLSILEAQYQNGAITTEQYVARKQYFLSQLR